MTRRGIEPRAGSASAHHWRSSRATRPNQTPSQQPGASNPFGYQRACSELHHQSTNRTDGMQYQPNNPHRTMPRSCVPLCARPSPIAHDPTGGGGIDATRTTARLAPGRPTRHSPGTKSRRPSQRSRQPRPPIAAVSVTGNPLVLLWVSFRDGPGCLVWLFWDSTRSSSFPHLGGCIRFGHLQLVPIPADAAFCLVQTVRFVWCSSVRVPESG